MAQKLISWYAYFYSGFVAIIAPRLFLCCVVVFLIFRELGLLFTVVPHYTLYHRYIEMQKKYTFTILDSMATNCKIQYDNRI